MRISTASVIIAALCLGTPALVQAQGAQPKAPPQAPSEQSIVIRSIQIVNVKDLKPEVRSKVEDLAAKTSEDDHLLAPAPISDYNPPSTSNLYRLPSRPDRRNHRSL